MSGWTTATVHGEEQEQINEELHDQYGDGDRHDLPSSQGYADKAVQFARGAGHAGVARRLVDDLETEPDHIIVVSANDTTDSGYGTLFEVSDGNVEKVERFEGYEGARGADVTGYFYEEYGLSSYATREA